MLLDIIVFLADHTAAHSMIDCCHHNVIHPSMTLCIVALRVGVEGRKLYRHVPSRALPIHFRRFGRRMYRLATKHKKTYRK